MAAFVIFLKVGRMFGFVAFRTSLLCCVFLGTYIAAATAQEAGPPGEPAPAQAPPEPSTELPAVEVTAAPAAAKTAKPKAKPVSAPSTTTLPAQTDASSVEQGSGSGETAWGPVNGYVAERTATGIKTDTPISEIPQSISVVTRDQMDDQGVNSIQESLNYTAGAYAPYGTDSRFDTVFLRGTFADLYLDGMRKSVSGDISRIDPYTLERVEVLRGPSGVLYGQGSTAGIVNMVSKRPSADHVNEIGTIVGNYSNLQGFADLGGKLTQDGTWTYRLITVGRDRDAQVDFVEDDHALIAPSITWRPVAGTSLTVLGNAQRDQTGSTQNYLPAEGTLFPSRHGRIPTSRFTSEPGFDRYDVDQGSVTVLFESRLNETWTVRQNARFTTADIDRRTVFSNNYVGDPYLDPARRTIARDSYINPQQTKTFTSDSSAEAKFETGPLKHKVLVGVDYTRFHKESATGFIFATGGAPLDLFDPVYGNFTVPDVFADPDYDLEGHGIYAQEQLKAGPWIAVLGIRRDELSTGVQGAAGQDHAANTYRAGLMYELPFGVTPYVTYAQSFTPVEGVDFFNAPFEPLRGDLKEAGVKYVPAGGNLSVTAALFDITEENRLSPDPLHADSSVQGGAARFRGFDIEATGKIGNVEFIAAYAYISAENTDGDAAGLDVFMVPDHQASLWAKYSFSIGALDGFAIGAGVRYVGAAPNEGPRYGIDLFETKPYAMMDGVIEYEDDDWRLAINGTNLTDEIEVSGCVYADCYYAPRRAVFGTLAHKF
jgi:iron complex outermembrane receptor protein